MTAPLSPVAPSPASPSEPRHHDALLPATRLDEFEIIRVLGAGGFGIVYLALDHVLLRYVAIKEYMPTALAGRGTQTNVAVRSAALADTFALGLESFYNEARMLAAFDHPSLVKVYRFWKANGTAYMVMPYYAGLTLKDVRRDMVAAPDEPWLRALVEPLLGALEVLHGQGVYHRDIAPDNILLMPDGRPVLLDFGSARRVIGNRTQSLTAILKPNFAPVEQYADEAGMRQGPWTDLYALGATVHFVLTGQAPTPSVLRAVRDALPALSAPGGAGYPGVPAAFLATIDWTLALAPNDRPQDVASVRQGLRGDVVPPPPSTRFAVEPRLPVASMGDDTAAAESVAADPAVPGNRGPRPDTALPMAAVALVLNRRGLRSAVATVALTGLGALGWGAWALSSPTLSPVETAHRAAIELPAAVSVEAAPPPALTEVVATAPRPVAATHPTTAVSRPLVTPNTASLPVRPTTGLAPRATALTDAAPSVAKPGIVSEPRSPDEACRDRNFLSLALCASRQCDMPRWRNHPQCLAGRQVDEQRQRRMEQ